MYGEVCAPPHHFLSIMHGIDEYKLLGMIVMLGRCFHDFRGFSHDFRGNDKIVSKMICKGFSKMISVVFGRND